MELQLKEMGADAPFVHRRRLRFGESDAASIVYTVRFFDYALDAIDAWYEAIAGVSLYDLNTKHGLSCPFVHTEMNFHAPLRPGDDLCVRVLIGRMGRSSLRFLVEGCLEDGSRRFSGQFTVSFIAPTQMKSVSIPGVIAERVALYQSRCAEALGFPGPSSLLMS